MLRALAPSHLRPKLGTGARVRARALTRPLRGSMPLANANSMPCAGVTDSGGPARGRRRACCSRPRRCSSSRRPFAVGSGPRPKDRALARPVEGPVGPGRAPRATPTAGPQSQHFTGTARKMYYSI